MRLKQEAERKAQEELKRIEDEKKMKAKLIKDYFKNLAKKGLMKYVGRPVSAERLRNHAGVAA